MARCIGLEKDKKLLQSELEKWENNAEHLVSDYPELVRQWSEKNGLLKPEKVTMGSNRKVWWVCEKGHEWQATVRSRVSGAGCPICSGREPWKGHDDLATTHPQLVKQWHPYKNGKLTPEKVKAGSHKKIWWVCEKGHEWQAPVYSRTHGNGCPVCSNRKILPGYNDLATLHPELVKQWGFARNGDLKPDQIGCGYDRKVWWICKKGHEWQATVRSRVEKATGCPVCANRRSSPGENDLKTCMPHLAAQWHPWRNGDLTPEDVTTGSSRNVWWQCPRGHEWRAKVIQRVRRMSECPYCSGQKVLPGFNDLATIAPEIAAQWHPVLNGTLTPQMVTAGSNRKVWWICPEGHIWRAAVANRALPGYKHTGCPVCAGRTSIKNKQEYYHMIEKTQV